MREYARPPIERVEFRDDSGTVINYGERWADLGGPPEDSYSVEDHQERFAPLLTVATALIDHLTANYEVDIEDGAHVAANLPGSPEPREILRAVRLTPRDAACAPVTIILAHGYWVRLQAGALFSEGVPSCTCNACDETWESAAEELESHVLAIVAGGLTETIGPPQRAKWGFERGIGFVRGPRQAALWELSPPGEEWAKSSSSPTEHLPAALLDVARERLAAVAAVSQAGNWLPWPRKSGGGQAAA